MKKILFAILIILNYSASASHIVGADLRYMHISGNTYKIICSFYGDCGPAGGAAFSTLPYTKPQICIYDGNTSIDTMHLTNDSSVVLYYECLHGPDSSQCTNTSYTYPGFKKYTYTGIYTLPYTSHYWRFIFAGGVLAGSSPGRAAAITNIGAGSTIELIDTLDNTWHPNTSPTLNDMPEYVYCLSVPDTSNIDGIDPDGDTLRYALTPAIAGTGICSTASPFDTVIYTGIAWPGTSICGKVPLQCVSGSFSFNTISGQMIFTPNILQRSIVDYTIREFRNDTFMGSCQREMTFELLCTPLCSLILSSASTLNIKQVSTTQNITLIPNPAKNTCKIHSDIALQTGCNAELYDYTGRRVDAYSIMGKDTEISLKNMNAGVYQCRIINLDGSILVLKLVITR